MREVSEILPISIYIWQCKKETFFCHCIPKTLTKNHFLLLFSPRFSQIFNELQMTTSIPNISLNSVNISSESRVTMSDSDVLKSNGDSTPKLFSQRASKVKRRWQDRSKQVDIIHSEIFFHKKLIQLKMNYRLTCPLKMKALAVLILPLQSEWPCPFRMISNQTHCTSTTRHQRYSNRQTENVNDKS